MRIAFFTDCYFPNINGVTTSIFECKKELAKMGHEVFVYAPAFPAYREEDPRNFRIFSVPFPFQPEYRFSIPACPELLEKARLEVKPDIVHIHSIFNLGWTGIWLGKTLKIPVIFTHHTFWEDYCHYFPLIPESWGKKLARSREKAAADNCNLVIAPSAEAKNRLKDLQSKTPVEVLPTGIELDLFNGEFSPEKKSDGVCNLLYVGRLGKEKNLPLLLQGLKELQSRGLDARLLLVGDGPERPELEKVAARLNLGDSAQFLGYRPRSELGAFYQAADLFVFPSVSETQGLVMVEAASSGLPVVAVDCEVTRELLAQDIIAALSPGEPRAFAQKVADLWENPEKLPAVRAAAMAGAQFFSRENLTGKLLSFYQKTLSREGKTPLPG